jgi:GNAT acetyltransferase-like protein
MSSFEIAKTGGCCAMDTSLTRHGQLDRKAVSNLDSLSMPRFEFHLQPYREEKSTWRQVVTESSGDQLYLSELWIDLLERAYRFPLSLATIQESGKAIAAACVFARSRGPINRRFISLPFSDSGALLARDDEAASALLASLLRDGTGATSYEIRGFRAAAPWQTIECFVDYTLDLGRSLAAIERGLDSNFRRNLRRAANQGIEIDTGDTVELMSRFYTMQLESRHHLGLPAQPWRFFKSVQELFAPGGDLDIRIARQNGHDVASAVFLRYKDLLYYKWGARRQDQYSSANHLLFWNAIQDFASHARLLDLGRTDVRNAGLIRFKRGLGATSTSLPVSFYPRAPAHVSAEVLTGARKLMAGVWRKLPISAARILSNLAYGFLA